MSWKYCTHTSPKVYTEKSFLFLIGYRKRDFFNLANNKSSFYKKVSQLKKDGIRLREIYRPDWELKRLLKSVNRNFLAKLNFPAFVHCGPKGRSIITASKGHKRFKYHLSLDIESFFDRVQEYVVKDALREIGIAKPVIRAIVSVAIEDNKLPQGFPTSPLLSTIVISLALQDFYGSFDRKLILLSVLLTIF